MYGFGQENSDKGLCYYKTPQSGVDESLLNPYFSTLISNNIPSPNYLPYFDFSALENNNKIKSSIYKNPVLKNDLSFEDSISWGCVDNLNKTGLKYYCQNQLWKNKMMFNLIQNITYISQFGNPNNQYNLDWITVDQISLDSYQSIWDDAYNKCTIPGVLNVDIMWGNYGLVNNTQKGIFKVKFRLDNIYWWSKNINDNGIKDKFFSYVNINFMQIPTDKVWWYAPGPGFIMLPQNIMYPFRIGTTTYGIQTSSSGNYLDLNLKTILFNLLIFLLITFN